MVESRGKLSRSRPSEDGWPVAASFLRIVRRMGELHLHIALLNAELLQEHTAKVHGEHVRLSPANASQISCAVVLLQIFMKGESEIVAAIRSLKIASPCFHVFKSFFYSMSSAVLPTMGTYLH